MTLVCGLPDGVNHRITDLEVMSFRHKNGRAKLLCNLFCHVLQFGRAHIRGRGIDQIAHKCRRVRHPHHLGDGRRIVRQQNFLRDRVGLGQVAVEAMVSQKPTQRHSARISVFKAINAFGKSAGSTCKGPNAAVLRIPQHHAPITDCVSGSDQQLTGLRFEPRSVGRSPHPFRLGREPSGIGRLADDLDHPRRLSLIRLKKGCKVSHDAPMPSCIGFVEPFDCWRTLGRGE